jgi:hypothetical protein
MSKLVKIAPWVVGLVLVLWGMKHFGLHPKDVLDLVNDNSQQLSQDTRALANGAAIARIKTEYQTKKFEIEMPDTTGMDEDTKKMVQELHDARQEMIELRKQAADQRLNSLLKQ